MQRTTAAITKIQQSKGIHLGESRVHAHCIRSPVIVSDRHQSTGRYLVFSRFLTSEPQDHHNGQR